MAKVRIIYRPDVGFFRRWTWALSAAAKVPMLTGPYPTFDAAYRMRE